MSGIEEDNLVLGRIVVFLVSGQEYVGAEVGKHLPDAVHKDVGMLVAVVGIDVAVDSFADIADKLVRIGLFGQFGGDHVGLAFVALERVVEE